MYKVGDEESVAFLYAKDRVGLAPVDEIRIGDARSEWIHRYRALGERKEVKGSWWYDGEYNNVLFPTPAITRTGASTTLGCEFRLRIDSNNHGIRLVRTTDKEDNRQLASVFVDGVRVKERKWFAVDFDRTFRGIRWFDSSFEIPANYTRGKRTIQVRVELESSKTGRWEDYGYTAYEYR